MTCNKASTTLTDGWNWLLWETLNIFVCNMFLYFLWRRDWFKSITSVLRIPIPQSFYFFCLLALTVANGWSGYALWHCRNWDQDFIPLLIHVLMIVFVYGFPFVIMVTKEPIAYLFAAFVCVGLSAAYTGIGWTRDVFVGIVGIFDIVVSLFYFVFAFATWFSIARVHEHHVNQQIAAKMEHGGSDEDKGTDLRFFEDRYD
jgi:hypothetical protein